MLNLPMTVTYLILTRHGGYSRWHDACARVRPYNIDKPERSSSGSRHAPHTSPHQALSAFISSQSNQRQTGNHNGKTVFLLVLARRNITRIAPGSTASSHLLQVIRLHVKRGAPEHRDSGALTGSPALTPWPCPRHRDLAYQWRLSSLEVRDLRT